MGQSASNVKTTGNNLNRKLGLEPIQSVQSSESPAATILAVLFLPPCSQSATDNTGLYRIVLVTSRTLEEYCLITGAKGVHVYREPAGAEICSAVALPVEKEVVLCNSVGTLRVVQVQGMRALSALAGNAKGENDPISTLTSIASGCIAVGHNSGIVRVLSILDWELKGIFNTNEKGRIPSVRKLAYWRKGKSLLSGHDNICQSVPVAGFGVRQYSVDLAAENEIVREKSGELSGLAGACVDLKVLNRENLAVAVGSESKVYVWSLQSQKLVMMFEFPGVVDTPAIVCSMCAVPSSGSGELLVFGLSEGTAVCSVLSLSDESRLQWTPSKLIKPTQRSKRKPGIACLEYDECVDVLAVGDCGGRVRIVNNFVWEAHGKQGETAQDSSSSQSVPASTAQEKTPNSGFAAYLHSRKSALQSSSPSTPYQDILRTITREWQALSPAEKQRFEAQA